MARTKGSKNVTTLIAEGLLPPSAKGWSKKDRQDYMDQQLNPDPRDSMTDKEILDELRGRFDVFARLVRASAHGMVNSVIISGSAGISKTYTAEKILEHEEMTRGIRRKLIKGTISPIDLYEAAYNMRNESDILMLDDADRIFADEEGLNILKALLDTSDNRQVSWMTDHPRFKGDSALPKSFQYNGSIIFITNRNFYAEIERGASKYIEHMKALLDRSIYIDLKIHDRRTVALWVTHIVTLHRILQGMGLSAQMEQDGLKWLRENVEDVRELSIRTVVKMGKMMLMSQSKNKDITVDWREMASLAFLKNRG